MKKFLVPLLSACLVPLAVVHAYAQATLYGIGDLAGGKTYSQVNDATKVGGVIYAVGGSTATSATNNNDRAVLWTYNTGNSATSLTAITDFVTNTAGTGGVIAAAITPDAASIAARLHNNVTNGVTMAALVTTSGLATTSLGTLNGTTSSAVAISNDGTVLYGTAQYSGNAALSQVVRYTNSANSITTVPFPVLNGSVTATNMLIASRASVSADGDTIVGTANTGGVISTAGSQAFSFNYSTNDLSADIPFLSGGTWNAGIAINSAATLGLIAGNSTAYPNGAVYLFNDTTNTLLGSPNPSYSFVGGGSLNADGSLVTAAFNNGSAAVGYIHNSSGWYSLDAVATALGANMSGWSNLNVFGMAADGSLLWGNGLHNGFSEGFVLDLNGASLSAIPEPSTYAAFAGLGALGLAVWRRRRPRV